MRRLLVFGVFVALILLALAPVSSARDDRSDDGERKRSRSKTVIVNAAAGMAPATWEWESAEITIQEGDIVEWRNPTDTEHAVDPYPASASSPHWWTGKDLPPGGIGRFQFENEGVYKFGCSITTHSDCWYLGTDECECIGMCGVITVKERG